MNILRTLSYQFTREHIKITDDTYIHAQNFTRLLLPPSIVFQITWCNVISNRLLTWKGKVRENVHRRLQNRLEGDDHTIIIKLYVFLFVFFAWKGVKSVKRGTEKIWTRGKMHSVKRFLKKTPLYNTSQYNMRWKNNEYCCEDEKRIELFFSKKILSKSIFFCIEKKSHSLFSRYLLIYI